MMGLAQSAAVQRLRKLTGIAFQIKSYKTKIGLKYLYGYREDITQNLIILKVLNLKTFSTNETVLTVNNETLAAFLF